VGPPDGDHASHPRRSRPGGKAVTTLREWLSRLVATVRPGRSNADLEEELRLHLELATEEELNRGRASGDARQSALARSGGAARALDALRDQRDLPRLRDAVQDLRHASRSLRRAPGFALMAVITLASGLGATATVFSAVDALFIRPLAVTAPHELFVVRRGGEALARFPLEFYQELEESRTAFRDPVASFTFPVTLTVSGAADRARAAFVTPNYFDALGIQPGVGRFLQPHDTGDVVVISHRLWRQLFGGRRSVVGEVVRIGASAFVIGGVAPPGFGGLQLDIALDLWLPMSASSTAVPLAAFRP
jgi:macrolide transport system ATP-binding/permease protein